MLHAGLTVCLLTHGFRPWVGGGGGCLCWGGGGGGGGVVTQIAEEILQRRQRIHDLRECGCKLLMIQSKIQTMINANFTYSAIQSVNMQIERASVDLSIEQDVVRGMSLQKFKCLRLSRT